MKRLFKAGERVRRTEGDHEGEVGTVKADEEIGNAYISVTWDNPVINARYGEQSNWWSKRFVLCDPPPAPVKAPLGTRADLFTDSDGTEMVMICVPVSAAKALRQLAGMEAGAVNFHPFWLALRLIWDSHCVDTEIQQTQLGGRAFRLKNFNAEEVK